MLQKLIDPAEHTDCNAQKKEEQQHNLNIMFISLEFQFGFAVKFSGGRYNWTDIFVF
jgi:hypothetical protein